MHCILCTRLRSTLRLKLRKDLLPVAKGCRVVYIQKKAALQLFISPLVLLVLNIKQGKELSCAQIARIHRQHLLQLQNRNIQIIGIAAFQSVIISLDGAVKILHRLPACLNLCQILRPEILLAVKSLVVDVLGDHPLRKCRNRLSDLVVNETEKIPGIQVILVEPQTVLQRQDCTGKIPHLCLLQPVIIQIIGRIYNFLISAYIRSAVRTMIRLIELAAAFEAIH